MTKLLSNNILVCAYLFSNASSHSLCVYVKLLNALIPITFWVSTTETRIRLTDRGSQKLMVELLEKRLNFWGGRGRYKKENFFKNLNKNFFACVIATLSRKYYLAKKAKTFFEGFFLKVCILTLPKSHGRITD